MKKTVFAFLGLTAILTVAGCSASKATTASAASETGYKVPAQNVFLKRKSTSLYIGKTYKLDVLIRPFAAYDAHLNYVSSDPNIATVDASGTVTGKNSGTAVISVFTDDYDPEYPDENLIDTFEVVVVKKSSFSNVCGTGKAASQMLDYQEQYCQNLDSARLFDHRVYSLEKYNKKTKKYEVQDRTIEYQTYVVSKSLGLVSYDSLEIDTNVIGGGDHYTEYGYTFYTTANYSSYIYHRNDNVRKYFYAPTEFNMGKEAQGITRYTTMLEVIGSLFSVPGTYFTGAVDDIYDEGTLKDMVETTKSSDAQFDNYGLYKDNNNFIIKGDFSVDYTGYPDSAFIDPDTGEWISYMVTSVEDECRLASQLPAGLKFKPAILMDTTWVNGYVKDFSYRYDKVFTWNGEKYKYVTELRDCYDVITTEEAARYIPGDDYDSVEHYYDL